MPQKYIFFLSGVGDVWHTFSCIFLVCQFGFLSTGFWCGHFRFNIFRIYTYMYIYTYLYVVIVCFCIWYVCAGSGTYVPLCSLQRIFPESFHSFNIGGFQDQTEIFRFNRKWLYPLLSTLIGYHFVLTFPVLSWYVSQSYVHIAFTSPLAHFFFLISLWYFSLLWSWVHWLGPPQCGLSSRMTNFPKIICIFPAPYLESLILQRVWGVQVFILSCFLIFSLEKVINNYIFALFHTEQPSQKPILLFML